MKTTVIRAYVLFYINREKTAIQNGKLDEDELLQTLQDTSEEVLAGIILTKIQYDEIHAVVNDKKFKIRANKKLAIIIAQTFKRHFLFGEKV